MVYQSNIVRLNISRVQLSNAVASAALSAKWEGFYSNPGVPEQDLGEIESKNLYFDKVVAKEAVIDVLCRHGFIPIKVDVALDDYYLYLDGTVMLPKSVYFRKASEQNTMDFHHKVRLYKNYSQ